MVGARVGAWDGFAVAAGAAVGGTAVDVAAAGVDVGRAGAAVGKTRTEVDGAGTGDGDAWAAAGAGVDVATGCEEQPASASTRKSATDTIVDLPVTTKSPHLVNGSPDRGQTHPPATGKPCPPRRHARWRHALPDANLTPRPRANLTPRPPSRRGKGEPFSPPRVGKGLGVRSVPVGVRA
jgi:hypothetical protein